MTKQKGVFKYVPYEMVDYLKTKNYDVIRQINPYWNACGCSSPDVNKEFPYIMELLNNQKNYTYKEWIEILNDNISFDAIVQTQEILNQNLKDNGIELSYQTLDEIIYIKIVYETWIGYCNEHAVYNFLKHNLHNVKQIQSVPGWVDRKYGVDLVVTTKDDRQINIQIKPASFLTISLQKQEAAKTKIKRYCKEYGGIDMFVFCDHTMVSDVSKRKLIQVIDNSVIEPIELYDNQRLYTRLF